LSKTPCAVIGCKLKQNDNEGCNSCGNLAGLVLSFIACFILLVIAPLPHYHRNPALSEDIFQAGFNKKKTFPFAQY